MKYSVLIKITVSKAGLNADLKEGSRLKPFSNVNLHKLYFISVS